MKTLTESTKKQLAERFEERGAIITSKAEVRRLVFHYDSLQKAESLMITLGIGSIIHRSNTSFEFRIVGIKDITDLAKAIREYLGYRRVNIEALIKYYETPTADYNTKAQLIPYMKRFPNFLNVSLPIQSQPIPQPIIEVTSPKPIASDTPLKVNPNLQDDPTWHPIDINDPIAVAANQERVRQQGISRDKLESKKSPPIEEPKIDDSQEARDARREQFNKQSQREERLNSFVLAITKPSPDSEAQDTSPQPSR